MDGDAGQPQDQEDQPPVYTSDQESQSQSNQHSIESPRNSNEDQPKDQLPSYEAATVDSGTTEVESQNIQPVTPNPIEPRVIHQSPQPIQNPESVQLHPLQQEPENNQRSGQYNQNNHNNNNNEDRSGLYLLIFCLVILFVL
ncbi:hypothetical protein BN7_2000 [Wickerhamomyces ciferrii]|uniref:Uncharacterized protein n=1 Tax=Wickerhamomyces ciferrii (strain ATCC 14091 / BCRC 22168 / CBS 111 / JCM 3599 / NBRC 0793 / NRRL Y-1031 F-60-10) TaxID=1206466 RepID=K0KBM9_WICCF|nr:uncharacterized protein BN7_2000 [Wickerhamomyces ciferrii]CCH42455.1 hypothetical protein BN7_2000 [Wickerhamomyces ciferrii]